MPRYRYKVMDSTGSTREGILEADNPREAAARLKENNYFILNIETEKTPKGRGIRNILPPPRVSKSELGFFCRQLAVMLEAGIPLLSGLSALKKQLRNKRMALAIMNVHASLESGKSFSYSLGKHPEVFPRVLISMVEAGEKGGVLDRVLNRMAEYFQWEHHIRERIKSSITYPSMVLTAAVLAMVFIIIFVLPVFQGILQQIWDQLPFFTRLLLSISGALRNYWYLGIIFASTAVYFLFRLTHSTPEGRVFRDKAKLRIPIFGGLIQRIIISRFCYTLATLLNGGIPILDALEVVEGSVDNIIMEKGIQQIRISIREGMGMAVPMERTGVFPPLVVEMISIGEEVGAMGPMLEKVGEFYDREVEDMANRLSVILEPTLVVFVGVIVGLVLLSVLHPLFKIMGSVH